MKIALALAYPKHTLRFNSEISLAYLKLAQICLILNASIKDRNGNETYSLDRSKRTTQNAPEKNLFISKTGQEMLLMKLDLVIHHTA